MVTVIVNNAVIWNIDIVNHKHARKIDSDVYVYFFNDTERDVVD